MKVLDFSSDATVDVNWDRHPKDVNNTCQTANASDAITSAMARPCLFEIQGISGHGFLDQWHSLPRRHLSRATASARSSSTKLSSEFTHA